MSMDVTQLRGYNCNLYDDLRTAVEKSGSMSVKDADAKLITLVNAGQSFADAVAQVKAEIPSLTPPSDGRTMGISDLQNANQSTMDKVKSLISQMGDAKKQGNVVMLNQLSEELDYIFQNEQISAEDFGLIESLMAPIYA